MSIVKGVFESSEQTKTFPEENNEIVSTKELGDLLSVDDKVTTNDVKKSDEFEQILVELSTVKVQTNKFLTSIIGESGNKKEKNRKRNKQIL
ncbi:hypothetical protein M0813_04066 [Anaeramoeba flamelloides]|uniref:Uncharacterized protein n=1 Tax=Anaeramoeba flamelloides TaxID=1746091 RepID=A0ABQ8XNS4_9EUKA|nr:hypothetical protein M0813_04066 [Anaeramoeba flamelloides]